MRYIDDSGPCLMYHNQMLRQDLVRGTIDCEERVKVPSDTVESNDFDANNFFQFRVKNSYVTSIGLLVLWKQLDEEL